MPARFTMQGLDTPPARDTLNAPIEPAGRTPAQLAYILRMRIEELDRRTDSKYALEYSSAYPPSYSVASNTPIRERYRWVMCYPVTGGSEGHYLHVTMIYQRDKDGHPLRENQYQEVVLVKIFGGWDAAAELAGKIGAWLGA